MCTSMALKESESFADWSSLPEHLWLTIFSKCSPMDLLPIKDVCLDWRRIASDFSLTTHLDFKSTDNKTIDLNSFLDLLIFSSNNLTSLNIDATILIQSKDEEHPKELFVNLTHTLNNHCKRLRRLSLKDFEALYLSYDDFPTNLSHLSLVNCNEQYPDPGLFQLFPQDCNSNKFYSIVYLNLSKMFVFESVLCQSLNRFCSLKYLYLEQLNRVNDGGITQIEPNIMSNLVVIDVEATDIKDESLEYILNNSISLEELYLNRTQISAAFDLSKSVAKKLKLLCILNTQINSMRLRDILRCHPNLQSVNCDQSIREVNDSLILKTKLPTTDTCLHYLTDNRFNKSN